MQGGLQPTSAPSSRRSCEVAQQATTPLPPSSTSAMCAQREAERGRMCRSERFCTLSTSQAHPQPHEAMKAAQIQIRFSPLVVVLLDGAASSSRNALKTLNKRVVKLNRLSNRSIIRLAQANRLQ